MARTRASLGDFSSGLAVLALTSLFASPALAEEVRLEEETSAATAEASVEEESGQPESNEASEASGKSATEEPASEPTTADFGHIGQFGVRVDMVAGYRMIFRYDDSPFCTEPENLNEPFTDQQKVCGHGAPLAMDVAVSFAPLDSIELFAWGRFGLTRETQTDTDAVTAFGAGLRIYTMSEAKLKIFVQPAVGMSFEGGGDNPVWQSYPGFKPSYKSDLLFQLAVGPQYDFNRYFGLYASGGLTVGVLRALSANLEGTLGLQGRLP
jgi:hypothetical protein